MTDFWDRKREELQTKGELPKPKPTVMQSNGAWWMVDNSLRGNQLEPPRPSEDHTDPYEGHDVSRAEHLRQKDRCPECGSGDYFKTSAATAARCWTCGHVEGRRLNEPNMPSIVSTDARTLQIRQTQGGGHFGRTAEEIHHNNAILEQSAQGRTNIV